MNCCFLLVMAEAEGVLEEVVVVAVVEVVAVPAVVVAAEAADVVSSTANVERAAAMEEMAGAEETVVPERWAAIAALEVVAEGPWRFALKGAFGLPAMFR